MGISDIESDGPKRYPPLSSTSMPAPARTNARASTNDVTPSDECMQLSADFQCPELARNTLFRVFFVISCCVQVMYAVYRCLTFWQTMPSVLMFWAEMPVNFWHVISGLQRWSCRDSRRASPLLKNLAPTFKDSQWPTVTVLIPTLNEEISVVSGTIQACLHMDWPRDKLWVYCLDDGGRKELQEECTRLSIILNRPNIKYISRPKPPGKPHHAKAGNINYALQVRAFRPFTAALHCAACAMSTWH